MILKITLVLLYLVIGLWLFVAAVTELGGKKQAFSNNALFILSMVSVMIFWPCYIIIGVIGRRNE